jgi:hypothetical protein
MDSPVIVVFKPVSEFKWTHEQWTRDLTRKENQRTENKFVKTVFYFFTTKFIGDVAQKGRAAVCRTVGCEFKSRRFRLL